MAPFPDDDDDRDLPRILVSRSIRVIKGLGRAIGEGAKAFGEGAKRIGDKIRGKPVPGGGGGGGSGSGPGGGKPPSSGGGSEPPVGETPGSGGGPAAAGGGKNAGSGSQRPGTGLGTIRTGRPRVYRPLTRAEVKGLENEMQAVALAMKRNTKMNKQMKIELDRLTKLAEDYANMLKAELRNQSAAMNLSAEEAAQLKLLVNELKQALKEPQSGKWYNFNKIQQRARVPGTCIQLAADMSFYAMLVGGILVLLGYIELDEPTPFNPRDTKAGKLLYDDFIIGLKVSSTCSAGFTHTTITSLLSGELDDLQSEMFIQRIEENWRCQLAVAPGRDVVLKGGTEDLWLNGLKFACNIPLYDGEQRKLVVNQKHRFGTVGGTVGLNGNPLLSLTAMFGSKRLSGGLLVDYDTVPGILRRLALGGVLNMMGVSASLMMEKILQPQQPQAAGQQPQHPQFHHQFSTTVHLEATEATSLGLELIHHMENHVTTVQAGVHHTITDSGTTIKCKLTNECVLSGMLQQNFGKSSISICTRVDLRAPHANPRVGLAISIVP